MAGTEGTGAGEMSDGPGRIIEENWKLIIGGALGGGVLVLMIIIFLIICIIHRKCNQPRRFDFQKQEKFSRLDHAESTPTFITVNPAFSYERTEPRHEVNSRRMHRRIAHDTMPQSDHIVRTHSNLSAMNEFDLSQLQPMMLQIHGNQSNPGARVPTDDQTVNDNQIPESQDSGINVENANFIMRPPSTEHQQQKQQQQQQQQQRDRSRDIEQLNYEGPGYSISLPELSSGSSAPVVPAKPRNNSKLMWNSAVMYQPALFPHSSDIAVHSSANSTGDLRKSPDVPRGISESAVSDERHEDDETSSRVYSGSTSSFASPSQKYKCKSTSGEIDIDISKQQIIVHNDFGGSIIFQPEPRDAPQRISSGPQVTFTEPTQIYADSGDAARSGVPEIPPRPSEQMFMRRPNINRKGKFSPVKASEQWIDVNSESEKAVYRQRRDNSNAVGARWPNKNNDRPISLVPSGNVFPREGASDVKTDVKDYINPANQRWNQKPDIVAFI